MSSPESRLANLGLVLPPAPKPMARYKPTLLIGDFLYVSGHGPWLGDGNFIVGRVGHDLTLDQGKEAARVVALAILASVQFALGRLDRVSRLVKTLGMVNCTPEFIGHPTVIDGFSELMAELFGADEGVGVRSAVGMGSLPNNIAVEVECMFQVKPE